MGIYINGMEMPKEGTVMVVDSTGQVWINQWPTRGYTRIDKVKAVELPPHGRLKDADALIVDLMDRGVEGLQMDDWYEIQQSVEDAPTIIEAEKEENND